MIRGHLGFNSEGNLKKIIFGQCFVSVTDFLSSWMAWMDWSELSPWWSGPLFAPGSWQLYCQGQKASGRISRSKMDIGEEPGEERLRRPRWKNHEGAVAPGSMLVTGASFWASSQELEHPPWPGKAKEQHWTFNLFRLSICCGLILCTALQFGWEIWSICEGWFNVKPLLTPLELWWTMLFVR